MRNGQDNEMLFILSILKNPKEEYNANSLAKLMKISAMGSLKIAKRLEKERILIPRKIGKASIYKINFNDYSNQYIKFLLKREIEKSSPYIKRWVRELEKLKNADGLILFDSILTKEKGAEDIDILVLVNQKKFEKVKKEIEEINSLNEKKVHPIYQTKQDLEKQIKENNKVILNALKGLYLAGGDAIIKIMQ